MKFHSSCLSAIRCLHDMLPKINSISPKSLPGTQKSCASNFTSRPFHKHSYCSQLTLHQGSGSLKFLLFRPTRYLDSYFTIQLGFRSSQSLRNVSNAKSDKEKAIAFKTSDTCLVFDKADALITQTTFGEAKAIASRNSSRLVYINKNPDGIFCFKLQALPQPGTPQDAQISSKHIAKDTDSKQRSQKNNPKVFNIKTSIGDHDFGIKMSRMQSLLVKGKQVVVFVNTDKSSSAATKEQKPASAFMRRLADEFKEVCKVHQDFSNDSATRFTLTPVEKVSSSSSS